MKTNLKIDFLIFFGGFLGLGAIKIFFAMSKTPRMQIMSSFGSGRVQFLIFLGRGSESKPNHRDVINFSVNRPFEK